MVGEPRSTGEQDGPRDTQRRHGQVYTVANVITVLRFVLIPFFFISLLSEEPNSDIAAFVLFVAAASTDFLDGMIARRTGTVTAIGAVIDPLVDRMLIAMGVLGLYIVDRLPFWVVVFLVSRDVYLLSGAYFLEKRHVNIPVTRLGKATTAVLLTAFSLLIPGWPTVTLGGREMLAAVPVLGAGMALSVLSAVQYTVLASRALAGSRAARSSSAAREGGRP